MYDISREGGKVFSPSCRKLLFHYEMFPLTLALGNGYRYVRAKKSIYSSLYITVQEILLYVCAARLGTYLHMSTLHALLSLVHVPTLLYLDCCPGPAPVMTIQYPVQILQSKYIRHVSCTRPEGKSLSTLMQIISQQFTAH